MREERAWPRRGWEGIVPAWVLMVRVVLKPARVWFFLVEVLGKGNSRGGVGMV